MPDSASHAEDGAREPLTGEPLALLVHALAQVEIVRETELGMDPKRFYLRPTEVQEIYHIVMAALAQQADGDWKALVRRWSSDVYAEGWRVGADEKLRHQTRRWPFEEMEAALLAGIAMQAAEFAGQAARHREEQDRYESQLDEVSGALSASQSMAAERLALLKDAEAEVARLRARLAEAEREKLARRSAYLASHDLPPEG